jgi:tryptophan halogenase
VALGLAAGFLEPLESTSIHLVQSGVERLVRFLPGAVIHDAERAAFNAQTRAEWENVRDFIIAHYAVNRRDEPFWRACAAMPLPDSLRQRLDLFAASGRLLRSSEELLPKWAGSRCWWARA